MMTTVKENAGSCQSGRDGILWTKKLQKYLTAVRLPTTPSLSHGDLIVSETLFHCKVLLWLSHTFTVTLLLR